MYIFFLNRYNFLVSENGQVFEGRGWGVEAAAAMGLSTRALHVALIGTFNHRAPAEGALKTVAKLIECGVELVGSMRKTLRVYRDFIK